MVVAVVACLVGLAAVLVALARDEPLGVPAPAPPTWDDLPTPTDIGRVEFPLAFPGYHPAHVDAYLDAVRAAYADLLAAAPHEVVQRARRRAALRNGRPLDAPPPADGPQTNAGRRPPVGDDLEALRLEAALSRLDDLEA